MEPLGSVVPRLNNTALRMNCFMTRSHIDFFLQDIAPNFHGFLDEEIDKTETLVGIRRGLIQSSLSLPDDEKFAAVDPKLLALYPPATALPQQATAASIPVQQVREDKTASKKVYILIPFLLIFLILRFLFKF